MVADDSLTGQTEQAIPVALDNLTTGGLVDRLAVIEKEIEGLEHDRKVILEALRTRQFKMPRMTRGKRAASATGTRTRKAKQSTANGGAAAE